MNPGDLQNHWHRTQREYQCRGPRQRSPLDGAQTAIVSWLWGCHRPSVLQAIVLGHSLHKHKTKADLVLCVDRDTMQSPTFRWANLLRCYWHLIEVNHLELPQHLRGTQQQRLTGVYSKLQTWRLFATGRYRQSLILMMDLDMLARRNIDELFQCQTPAAVMRGPADSCLFESRPSSSFFRGGSRARHESTGEALAGGVNGGLVLLKPDAALFQDMWQTLIGGWHTQTRMAEQEFISYFFACKEQWKSLHKKFNFQLHHLYLCGGDNPPRGQDRVSSYWDMARKPEEIAVWHFSSTFKPDMVLGMCENDDISDQHNAVNRFLSDFTAAEQRRHIVDSETIERHLEDVMLPCNQKATEEWLLGWQEAWPLIVLYVADFGARRCLKSEGPGGMSCTSCGLYMPGSLAADMVRNHVIANCSTLRKTIKLPMSECFDLDLLMSAPCGHLVECQLNYLAAVFDYYKEWQLLDNWIGPLPMSDTPFEEDCEPWHMKSSMQRLFAKHHNNIPRTKEEIAEENASGTRAAAAERWKKVWNRLAELHKKPPHQLSELQNAEAASLLRKATCVRGTYNQRLREQAEQRRQLRMANSASMGAPSSAASSVSEAADLTGLALLPPPPPPPSHRLRSPHPEPMRPQSKKRARTMY